MVLKDAPVAEMHALNQILIQRSLSRQNVLHSSLKRSGFMELHAVLDNLRFAVNRGAIPSRAEARIQLGRESVNNELHRQRHGGDKQGRVLGP